MRISPLWLVVLVACGGSPSGGTADSGGGGGGGGTDGGGGGGGGGGIDSGGAIDAPAGSAGPRTVFVIPIENKDSTEIYGDTTNAPYINSLITGSGAIAAHATNMDDELGLSVPSEPHYIWMEAGTNAFTDHTFTTDDDAGSANSTASTAHLSTQLDAAGKTWVAYAEGITTGTCPIATSGEYAPKHSPFLFFRDVSGAPPSATNAGCGAHYKAYTDLAADLASGNMPNYVFITPDLCDDMHGDLFCSAGIDTDKDIAAGDAWLQANLPALIAYTHAHDATIFLSWDEGDATLKMPFVAIGDHVRAGLASAVAYTHSSQLKTVEELLGVPILPTAGSATDLSALFDAGYVTP